MVSVHKRARRVLSDDYLRFTLRLGRLCHGFINLCGRLLDYGLIYLYCGFPGSLRLAERISGIEGLGSAHSHKVAGYKLLSRLIRQAEHLGYRRLCICYCTLALKHEDKKLLRILRLSLRGKAEHHRRRGVLLYAGQILAAVLCFRKFVRVKSKGHAESLSAEEQIRKCISSGIDTHMLPALASLDILVAVNEVADLAEPALCLRARLNELCTEAVIVADAHCLTVYVSDDNILLLFLGHRGLCLLGLGLLFVRCGSDYSELLGLLRRCGSFLNLGFCFGFGFNLGLGLLCRCGSFLNLGLRLYLGFGFNHGLGLCLGFGLNLGLGYLLCLRSCLGLGLRLVLRLLFLRLLGLGLIVVLDNKKYYRYYQKHCHYDKRDYPPRESGGLGHNLRHLNYRIYREVRRFKDHVISVAGRVHIRDISVIGYMNNLEILIAEVCGDKQANAVIAARKRLHRSSEGEVNVIRRRNTTGISVRELYSREVGIGIIGGLIYRIKNEVFVDITVGYNGDKLVSEFLFRPEREYRQGSRHVRDRSVFIISGELRRKDVAAGKHSRLACYLHGNTVRKSSGYLQIMRKSVIRNNEVLELHTAHIISGLALYAPAKICREILELVVLAVVSGKGNACGIFAGGGRAVAGVLCHKTVSVRNILKGYGMRLSVIVKRIGVAPRNAGEVDLRLCYRPCQSSLNII